MIFTKAFIGVFFFLSLNLSQHCYEEAMKGLTDSSLKTAAKDEVAHGSLLVLMELILNSSKPQGEVGPLKFCFCLFLNATLCTNLQALCTHNMYRVSILSLLNKDSNFHRFLV